MGAAKAPIYNGHLSLTVGYGIYNRESSKGGGIYNSPPALTMRCGIYNQKYVLYLRGK